MKLGRAVFLLASRLSVWSLLLAGGACLADVPTSLQECRLRNSAICELRGLQYVVEGPCPPPAQTVRSPGQERCEDVRPASPLREHPPSARTVGVPAAPRDLAWVGQIERWLIPVLLVVVGLLLAGLGLLAFRSWRAHRDGADTATGVGRLLLQLFAAAVIAVPLGYQAAGVAFQRTFSSFNNHDTAAPWLLAAPVGLIVFMLVSGIVFALVALLVGYLLPGFRKQPRNDPSRAMSAGQTGNRTPGTPGEKDRSP